MVSKTIGCVFESRLPCQNKTELMFSLIFLQGMDAYSTSKRKSFARLRLTRKQLGATGRIITSLFRQSLTALNFCSVLYFARYGRVFDRQAQILCAVASDAKETQCDRQDHYFAIPSKPYGFSLRIALHSLNITKFFVQSYIFAGHGRVFDRQAQNPLRGCV